LKDFAARKKQREENLGQLGKSENDGSNPPMLDSLVIVLDSTVNTSAAVMQATDSSGLSGTKDKSSKLTDVRGFSPFVRGLIETFLLASSQVYSPRNDEHVAAGETALRNETCRR
jgi:hypothetical protein